MSALVLNVCPECGSGKIKYAGELISADMAVSCLSCGWRGTHGALMAVAADEAKVMEKSQEIFGTPDLALGIAQEVSRAYLVLLSKMAAQPIGLAMIEAGVIGKEQPKELTRLIRSACLAAHKATLEEIETIQKELQDARRSNDN